MIIDRAVFYLFTAYMFVLGLAVAFLFMYYAPELQQKLYSSTDSNCSSLNDTAQIAYCLNEEFNSFWHYNISNLRKEMTEEQLKIEGGVCSHAAKWYKSKLDTMGLRAKVVDVYINKTVGHVHTRLEAEDAYCILDQTDVYCFRYGSLTNS